MDDIDISAALSFAVKDLGLPTSQLNSIQDEITNCFESLLGIEASGYQLNREDKLQMIHPLLRHAEEDSGKLIGETVADAPLAWIYSMVMKVIDEYRIASDPASYEKHLQDQILNFSRREMQLREEMQRILRLKEQEHIDEMTRIEDAWRTDSQKHARINMAQEQGLREMALTHAMDLRLQLLVNYLDNVVKEQHRKFIAALCQDEGAEEPSSRLVQERREYEKALGDFAIIAERSLDWARAAHFSAPPALELMNAKIAPLTGELRNLKKVTTDGGRSINRLFEDLCAQIDDARDKIQNIPAPYKRALEPAT